MYAQQHVKSLFDTSHRTPILSLLTCLLLISPAKSYADIAIGKATLVIGKAYIKGPGQEWRLKTGDAIYENRQIVTSASGHVHIRFNDQGLVSVRPNSRLSIDQYDYNATTPSQSTVKFSLIRGATRSVSGKAAKAAKQRFRMNTPIAAIGVRGTDFVVSADQKNIQANVNEGAIIVAPFSDQCSMDAVGPCAANAVVLSGGSNQLLKFNQLLAMPQLLPTTNKQLNHQLLAVSTNEISTDEEASHSPDKDSENSKDEELLVAFNEFPADESNSNSLSFSESSADSNRETTFVFNENSAKNSLTNPIKPIKKQLAWGRWGEALSTDTLAISSAEAGVGRNPAVGNLHFGLFRNGASESIAKDLGAISFTLTNAQASYTQDGNTSTMLVDRGSLSIDFNNKSFDTQLHLQHAVTGNINFNATGKINGNGFFIDRSSNKKLAGAVSIDGKEAGYFFNEDLDTGSIEGITLWGAQ